MSEPAPSQPSAPKGRVVLWLAGLGVPLLLLLAWWPSGKPKSRPALPNPNGYDYFVKAGGLLAGMWTNASPHDVSVDELQAYLTNNSVSLGLLREGLNHASHAPVHYDSTDVSSLLQNLAQFMRLGELLVGESHLAELHGNPMQALETRISAMRLGQEVSRGGLLIARLTGLSIEQRSLDILRQRLRSLDQVIARQALIALQKLDDSHEPAADNLEADDAASIQVWPVWHRFISQVNPAVRKEVREGRERFATKVNTLQATRRRAIVEAAARLFELEKSLRPTGYADLVPAYLKAIPLDPTTGKEIAHPF